MTWLQKFNLSAVGIIAILLLSTCSPATTQEPLHFTVEAPVLRVKDIEVVTEVVTATKVINEYVDTPTSADVRTVTITAYNSLASQTDSTPFITATGQRTRYGIVALSRDLLQEYPYGTRIVILGTQQSASSCGAWDVLPTVFEVQDTMHPRKTNQVDVWFEHLKDSQQWGNCTGTVLFMK